MKPDPEAFWPMVCPLAAQRRFWVRETETAPGFRLDPEARPPWRAFVVRMDMVFGV